MAMILPKGLDAIDLLYAVDSLCDRRPLRTMGLNRRGYRSAKKAQTWFFNEMVKAVGVRKKGLRRGNRTKA
jgi:hypothetical protein